MSEPKYQVTINSLPQVERLAHFVYIFIITYVVLTVIQTALGLAGFGKDDTDSATQRSGFILRTDYGTGCQYLVRGGAITPRWNAEGDQVGCVRDRSGEAGETQSGSTRQGESPAP